MGTETYFYSTFDKFQDFTRYPLVIPLDDNSVIGDHVVIDLVQKADFISRLYLDIGPGKTLADIEYFEIILSRVVVWRFTGEFLHISRMLKTPTQKTKLLDNLVEIPIQPFPCVDEVKFRFKVSNSRVAVANMSLRADFVFTGKPTDGEYIIEQLQMVNNPLNMNLRHSVKEIFIVVQDQVNRGTLVFSNVSGGHQITNMKLKLNQANKFNDGPVFFSTVQQMLRHTGTLDYVYVYPFCLEPENIKPTGTINMSRVINQNLFMTYSDVNPKDIRVYALSYNILTIKNNIGTLRFIL